MTISYTSNCSLCSNLLRPFESFVFGTGIPFCFNLAIVIPIFPNFPKIPIIPNFPILVTLNDIK